eukprot:340713-Alexandrium_andersonii.AAC.1
MGGGPRDNLRGLFHHERGQLDVARLRTCAAPLLLHLLGHGVAESFGVGVQAGLWWALQGLGRPGRARP